MTAFWSEQLQRLTQGLFLFQIFSEDDRILDCKSLNSLHMIISLVRKSLGAIGAIEFIRIYRQNWEHRYFACLYLSVAEEYRKAFIYDVFYLRSAAQHLHLCSVCLSVCPSVSKLNFSLFGQLMTTYDSL